MFVSARFSEARSASDTGLLDLALLELELLDAELLEPELPDAESPECCAEAVTGVAARAGMTRAEARNPTSLVRMDASPVKG
jgi:hypothetical protein